MVVHAFPERVHQWVHQSAERPLEDLTLPQSHTPSRCNAHPAASTTWGVDGLRAGIHMQVEHARTAPPAAPDGEGGAAAAPGQTLSTSSSSLMRRSSTRNLMAMMAGSAPGTAGAACLFLGIQTIYGVMHALRVARMMHLCGAEGAKSCSSCRPCRAIDLTCFWPR